MSNTSHCFAEKNVAGPVGGPSSGGTTTRLFPPAASPSAPPRSRGSSRLCPAAWTPGPPCGMCCRSSLRSSLYATYWNVTSCPSRGRSPSPVTKSLNTKPSSWVTNPSVVRTRTSYPSRTNVGNSSGALLYCLIFWLFSMAFASSSVMPRFCRSAVYFTRASMSGASPTGTSSKGISTTSSDDALTRRPQPHGCVRRRRRSRPAPRPRRPRARRARARARRAAVAATAPRAKRARRTPSRSPARASSEDEAVTSTQSRRDVTAPSRRPAPRKPDRRPRRGARADIARGAGGARDGRCERRHARRGRHSFPYPKPARACARGAFDDCRADSDRRR